MTGGWFIIVLPTLIILIYDYDTSDNVRDFFQEKMLLNCDNPTTPSEEIITWISLSLHAPNGQQPCLSPLNLLTMNPIHYVYIYMYIYIHIVIRKKIVKQFITVSVGFYFYILLLGLATPSSGGPRWGLWLQESWLIELDVPEKTTAA